MDFFTNSKPNLISNNILQDISNQFGNGSSIKDIKLHDGINKFYENYIQPNLFYIILLFIFLLFLYWKYELKNTENFANNNVNHIDQKIIDTYIEKQYKHRKKRKHKNKKITHKQLIPTLVDEYLNNNIDVQNISDEYLDDLISSIEIND